MAGQPPSSLRLLTLRRGEGGMTPFYFGVHVPAAIAEQLRRRGVDIRAAQDDGTTASSPRTSPCKPAHTSGSARVGHPPDSFWPSTPPLHRPIRPRTSNSSPKPQNPTSGSDGSKSCRWADQRGNSFGKMSPSLHFSRRMICWRPRRVMLCAPCSRRCRVEGGRPSFLENWAQVISPRRARRNHPSWVSSFAGTKRRLPAMSFQMRNTWQNAAGLPGPLRAASRSLSADPPRPTQEKGHA